MADFPESYGIIAPLRKAFRPVNLSTPQKQNNAPCLSPEKRGAFSSDKAQTGPFPSHDGGKANRTPQRRISFVSSPAALFLRSEKIPCQRLFRFGHISPNPPRTHADFRRPFSPKLSLKNETCALFPTRTQSLQRATPAPEGK